MDIHRNEPPREFKVGLAQDVLLKDCARIALNVDEQVTFKAGLKVEYDVARKSWGFYATPSINGRLLRFGLRAALVKNQSSQYFVLLVEEGKEADFSDYVHRESLTICGWLDDETLPQVEKALGSCSQ